MVSELNSLSSPLGLLPDGWRIEQLKNITTKIGSGATPPGGDKVYLPRRENFAFVRSQNIYDRYFDGNNLVFISDEHAKQLKGVFLAPDDILLNITGDGVTFARSCIVDNVILPACVNQHVSIIRVNPNLCVAQYLLGYLTHPTIKKYIEAFNAGGSRRAITKAHIESFLIPLPSLPEQKAIAAVLSALDDKIELNRRMNETLEAMAKALFKSWFVDFDPVRAKAEGRQPEGLSPEIAALFPDAFEDSELGEIPKGWHYIQITELGRVVCGKTPPTSNAEFYGGSVPFITIPDMHGKLIVTKVSKHLSTQGAEFQRSKYLPRHTTCVSCIATPGLVVLTAKDSQTNQQINSVIPENSTQALFNYFCIKQATGEVISHGSGGSVFHNLNTGEFSKLKVLVPKPELTFAFHQAIESIILKIETNQYQSENIANLRDSLLPKLMNGEIRVQQAQSLVEELV